MTSRPVSAALRDLAIVMLALLAVSPLSAQTVQTINQSRILQPLAAHSTAKPPVITAVSISPDGRQLAAAGDDHHVRVWSADRLKLLHELRGHADWVRAVAYHPSGRILATAGNDRRLILWRLDEGGALHVLADHPQAIHTLRFSPDGKLLAAAGFESMVRIYDVEQNDLARKIPCSCRDIRAIAFSPLGDSLASGGRDGQLRIWSIADGSLQIETQAHLQRIRALAYAPDGKHIATAGDGPHLVISDALTGEETNRLLCRPGKTHALVFVDQNLLVTGGSGNQLRVWDLQQNRQTYRLIGHLGSVASLDCHSEAGVLISGSFDTTIRLWNLPFDEDSQTADRTRETAR